LIEEITAPDYGAFVLLTVTDVNLLVQALKLLQDDHFDYDQVLQALEVLNGWQSNNLRSAIAFPVFGGAKLAWLYLLAVEVLSLYSKSSYTVELAVALFKFAALAVYAEHDRSGDLLSVQLLMEGAL